MKISYNWLKEHVYVDESPEQLASILTDCGLEVEGVEKYEQLKGNLKGVVTGVVLSCEKHPEADRLSLTKVDVGDGHQLEVVCGAPNVRTGQKVFVATVGTTLYTAGGEILIKKAKIRGQQSEGMICAEDELGLGTSHEGIMVLPDNTPVGIPAADFLSLEDDFVFEIGLTPNRIDAASHIGVARDLVAVLNHQDRHRRLKVIKPEVSDFKPDNTNLPVPVIIEDQDGCHRYCGVTISEVQVKESPDWLKSRLRAIGQKPINNVVDVTNFVLHELGQPLHAFDVSNIDGNKVIVKKSPAGTKFVTLDKEEVDLTGNDLMICNEKEPMCMAGILGGLKSGVTHSTTHVFLESAWFSPVTIRKSANHHGLKTDSSFRFERGADADMAPVALKRAAMLIKQLAGGHISSEMVDEYPVKTSPVTISLYFQTIDRLVGKRIPRDQITAILADLDFVIHEQNQEYISLTIPAYRVDVTREADVVEEILRIYGYNNIELPGKLHSSLVLSPKPDKERLQNLVGDMLASQGLVEIMNNSLTRATYYDGFGFSSDQSVQIINPLSQDLNVMRQSLLFGGLETILYNQNRKVHDLKLFEFGNVYWRSSDPGSRSESPVKGFHEQLMLALFFSGRRLAETWSATDTQVNYFDLKNAVQSVLKRLGLPEASFKIANHTDSGCFDYHQSLSLGDEVVISSGKLSDKLTKSFDIRQEVFAAFISWDMLLKHVDKQPLLYKEIARYPEVRRDLALLVDVGINFAEIERIAFATERKRLKSVGLFDVYQDDKLGRGKKSYAVNFILQDEHKTLNDKEIDQIMNNVASALTKQLDAAIR